MCLDEHWLLSRMLFMAPLFLSLTVHEWAHAWSAFLLGDDTAKRLGRLTLNPLAHIDPIGTLLLPAIGVPFGWAKPVPLNPPRFRRNVDLRTGVVLTAAAGPLSNICMAVGSMLLLTFLMQFNLMGSSHGNAMYSFLQTLILLNVVLAVFNALPIPPLDGSRIVDGVIPRRYRKAWDRFCRLGPIALFAVIALPYALGINLFIWPLEVSQSALNLLLTWFCV